VSCWQIFQTGLRHTSQCLCGLRCWDVFQFVWSQFIKYMPKLWSGQVFYENGPQSCRKLHTVGPVIPCVLFFGLDILSIFFEIGHPMFFVFFSILFQIGQGFPRPSGLFNLINRDSRCFSFVCKIEHSFYFCDRTSQIFFVSIFLSLFVRSDKVSCVSRALRIRTSVFYATIPPELRSGNEVRMESDLKKSENKKGKKRPTQL